ncbi:MAG: hypothetical protein WC337_04750 [Candidatus Muiribacteriota bacterium]
MKQVWSGGLVKDGSLVTWQLGLDLKTKKNMQIVNLIYNLHIFVLTINFLEKIL